MTTLIDPDGGGAAIAEAACAAVVVVEKPSTTTSLVATDARAMVAVDPETHGTAVVFEPGATRVVDRNAVPQVVVRPQDQAAVAVQPQAVARLVLAGFSGQPGKQGPAGPAGTDAFFRFVMASPAAQWPITHNLGKFPSVSVVDSAGQLGVGNTSYVDSNHVLLSFAAPFAGTAYLN